MAASSPDATPAVYLEDVVAASIPAEMTGDAVATSTVAKVTRIEKRQLSIADMFSSSQEKSPNSTAKKIKLTPSSGSLDSSSGSSTRASNSFAKHSSVQKLNSIPFSLSSYQDTLSDEEKRLLQLECQAMGKSWLKLLKDEIRKPYFLALKRFLWEEGVRGADDTPSTVKIYPSPQNIYAWSNTPLGKIKVIIIGQGKSGTVILTTELVKLMASAFPCLSVLPFHLRSEIYTPKFRPNIQNSPHPNMGGSQFRYSNLSSWASNGVLMLNTCLTVRAGEAGSHSNKGWEQFTDKVVDVVDRYGGANLPNAIGEGSESSGVGRGVVFLAWGAWAAKRVAKLNKTKHLILKSAHPSPFSANKGFLGNGHFKAANNWLEKKYGEEGKVDWCNLPGVTAMT